MSIPMERTIIQGIKRLRVLTPYDYDNMDELVQDLSNALEDSAFSRISPNKSSLGKKARAPWKRRSKSAGSLVTLGSSLPKSTVSEDSESSLDGRMRSWKMEACQPQSDSDDLPPSARHHYHRLTSWRHSQTVESDSVNENFLPSSQHRRKRKFKRMAVDMPPTEGVPDLNFALQKARRMKSAKPIKIKSSLPHYNSENKEGRKTFIEIDTSQLSGKRKRSMRERSVDCIAYDDGFPLGRRFLVASGQISGSSSWHDENNMMDFSNGDVKSYIEASSSSLSSSESDGGIITNDEGREGDDEHSDFFHESGPNWWEDEDAKFLLTHGLRYMSEAAKEACQNRLQHISALSGREIRQGRRRLGCAVMAANSPFLGPEGPADRISKLALETACKLRMEACSSSVGDIKRRRRTPPVSQAGFNPMGETCLPLTDHKPTSGWESSSIRNEAGACKGNFPPPPPPPPSPQPGSGGDSQLGSADLAAALLNLDFSSSPDLLLHPA